MTATHDQISDLSLLGRHASIVTNGRNGIGGAVYYRARIIRETENAFMVSFRRTNHETHVAELHTELIKKADIETIRLFED